MLKWCFDASWGFKYVDRRQLPENLKMSQTRGLTNENWAMQIILIIDLLTILQDDVMKHAVPVLKHESVNKLAYNVSHWSKLGPNVNDSISDKHTTLHNV